MIFLPEDHIKDQRRDPYPALYYLAGLSSDYETFVSKSGFARYAKKRSIAMVFPDTRPRGLDESFPSEISFETGFGAGHYSNATQAPWNEHWNMFTYVTEELPSLVERYFHVCPERRSITGFSMGGHGALMAAAKLPDAYRSVTAISPISNATTCERFCKSSFEAFFGSFEGGADFSLVDILNSKGTSLKLPPCYIDLGSTDELIDVLDWPMLIKGLRTNGHGNIPVNYHEGYDHSYYFVSSIIEDHIDFHAGHLYR